jgi:hypothetical protein
MTLKITTTMLDKLGGASHGERGCADVRAILVDAGVTDSVELHIYETTKVNELRRDAAKLTALADAIEARGPWPESRERWSDASR